MLHLNVYFVKYLTRHMYTIIARESLARGVSGSVLSLISQELKMHVEKITILARVLRDQCYPTCSMAITGESAAALFMHLSDHE